MKQLLILSGKGGTGKTTIAGAFIKLSDARAYADCDVDAPNLHLIMSQTSSPDKADYFALPKAEIDPQLCIECDQCRVSCRFNAIRSGEVYKVDIFACEKAYKVDIFACEGCGVCEEVCPAGAVSFRPAVAGEMMLYSDAGSVFSTARLNMGSGTSGMLVTEVKKRMKAAMNDADLAIIDGSPGIGCPVIASLSGADMVLVVAEPSISGISDMERIIRTADTFQVEMAVCVNKFDISLVNTERIEEFCRNRQIPFVGRIPFDPEAVKAINSGKTIVEVDCASGRAAREVYDRTMLLLTSEPLKTG
ncbi:MAG: ATP-binding protein [Saccharofermentanales bacterium]